MRCSNERDALDIPLREAYNAALLVLDEQIALPLDSLVKEMAKLFGYSRVGDNVYTAMSSAIGYAMSQGIVEKVDGKVRKA